MKCPVKIGNIKQKFRLYGAVILQISKEEFDRRNTH
jgi:hypothetical protein